MTDFFSGGNILVIMGIAAALIGGWIAVSDRLSRKRNRNEPGKPAHSAGK